MELLELAFDVSAGAEAWHSSKEQMPMENVVLAENLFGVVLVDYFALEMMIQEVESVTAHVASKNLMEQTAVVAVAVAAAENDVAAASLWPSDRHTLAAGCWGHDLLVLEKDYELEAVVEISDGMADGEEGKMTRAVKSSG